MIRARHAMLLALAGSLVLSACGTPARTSSPAAPSGSSSSPSPSPSEPPGTPLRAAAFTTVVPPGWTDKLGDAAEVGKFSANGRVEMLIEQGPPGQVQQDVNDVTANVNVLRLPSAVPDDQVATYLASVSNNGATNLSAPQSFTIDGATGQYITYDRDIQGTPGESQDMIINHAGETFDIVFNTSQFAFSKQQQGLQDVLAAWRWSS